MHVAGEALETRRVVFRLADPERRLRGVQLWQEVLGRGRRCELAWSAGAWTVELARPPVSRMEYLFEVTHADGRTTYEVDRSNPLRVGGAFGEHSVVEFPGYAPPQWLDVPAQPGRRVPYGVDSASLGARVDGVLWSCGDLPDDSPALLLAVHDGPEYDALASLTHYLAVSVASGALPPLRAALLAPGQRDERYSANPAYGAALARDVLPALRRQVAVTQVVGLGASLGGLAWLQAHVAHPGVLDGLFVQSGSFFRDALDSQERGFPYYRRIVDFVEHVLRPGPGCAAAPVPTALTCGRLEENLANNRLMSHTLGGRGYGAALVEGDDVHSYTAWRDCLHPHLTRLLRAVAS